MRTLKLAVAIVAASLSAVTIAPAFAQGSAPNPQSGHYEWRWASPRGPHANFPTRERVWVNDPTEQAACDCNMMKMSSADAADCMKKMHGAASPSGTSAS